MPPSTASAVASPAVSSPCVGICQLNAERTCVGCGRTLQEIAVWSGCNATARQQIIAKAEQRLQTLHTPQLSEEKITI